MHKSLLTSSYVSKFPKFTNSTLNSRSNMLKNMKQNTCSYLSTIDAIYGANWLLETNNWLR